MSFIFMKRLGFLWFNSIFRATSGALLTTSADKFRGCILLPVRLDFSADIIDGTFYNLRGLTSIVFVGTSVRKVEDSSIDMFGLG